MDKRVALFGLGIIALALYLLAGSRSSRTDVKPREKVVGLPSISYEIPPIVIVPGGSRPSGDRFDWMGGENCGCDGAPQNALIIDSVRVAPRTFPGYQYLPRIDIAPIPPALKGAVNIVQNPIMPNPQSYIAASPSFWWGWQGMSRVIYTSDGFTLRTGFNNRLWTDITPGGNVFSEITRIRHGAQEYELNRSRSVGL